MLLYGQFERASAPTNTATTLAYYSMERGGVGAAGATASAAGNSTGLELSGNEICLQDLVSNAHHQHQQHVHQLQSEHLMQHGHHLEHIHAAAAAANHHHEHHVSAAAATAAAAAMLHNGGAGAHHHQSSLHHEPLEKLKRGESILVTLGIFRGDSAEKCSYRGWGEKYQVVV